MCLLRFPGENTDVTGVSVFVVTADIRVHEFFKTSYFKTGIHPIPGAQQALQKLSRYCDLSIVTYVLCGSQIY